MAFAEENDAPHLTRQAVVGRPLWDFIAGEETRHLYQVIFQRIREEKHPATIPFRCDSPDCRRYMEMHMAPAEDGGITFINRVVRMERRPAMSLLDHRAPRSGEFIIMCSWCKRIQLSEGRWAEVEAAIRDPHLFDKYPVPQISHGICPECRDRAMRVWEEHRAG